MAHFNTHCVVQAVCLVFRQVVLTGAIALVNLINASK